MLLASGSDTVPRTRCRVVLWIDALCRVVDQNSVLCRGTTLGHDLVTSSKTIMRTFFVLALVATGKVYPHNWFTKIIQVIFSKSFILKLYLDNFNNEFFNMDYTQGLFTKLIITGYIERNSVFIYS